MFMLAIFLLLTNSSGTCLKSRMTQKSLLLNFAPNSVLVVNLSQQLRTVFEDSCRGINVPMLLGKQIRKVFKK